MALEGLRDKVAIVTGAGGGIGSAVALRLSQEGARVVLVDLDGAAAERAAAELPGDALGCQADIATEAGVDGYMEAALARFGRVDVVHLNAGYAGKLVPFVESETADFDRVIGVNVRGAYLGLRAAIRQMLAQGDGGSIVVTSSGLGLRGGQLWAPYAASKHAVIGLVRSTALESARDGIRVNAICPGLIDTAMVRPTEDVVGGGDRVAARKAMEQSVPLGRYGLPSEPAGIVAWLLSGESSYCTGGVYSVDGGIEATPGGFAPPAE